MNRLVWVVLAVVAVVQCGRAVADDAFAIQCAAEVVEVLQVRLERLSSVKSAPASELAELESRVLNARLVLHQLRGDADVVRRLMEDRIVADKQRLKRVMAIAKRGYAGPDQLRVAKLRVLISEQDLALHMNDNAALARIVDNAIVIEKLRLARIEDMADRGFTPSSSVVDQKLRFAQIIANQRVTVADTDS